MSNRDLHSWSLPCPSVEELAAYTAGKLTLGRLETVAEHLLHCPACARQSQKTEGATDSFIVQLRRSARHSHFLNEHDQATVDPERNPLGPQSLKAPDPSEPEHPSQIGPYQILSVLGSGGMGEVYLAYHSGLDREVALKIIQSPMVHRRDLRQRFQLEARAIARLQHPGIVQIFDIGEQGHRPYFAMELLEGGSLARFLQDHRVSAAGAARLIQQVARAMHHAHQKGVLHRDLKPGNILLTELEEPKVGDFGLAKLLSEPGSDLTQTDAIIGTPEYMAPEQAGARLAPIGPSTDVYSMGAVLYRMLTGRPPFRGSNSLETLKMVREEPLVPPSVYHPGLNRDLELICLKCLERHPHRRYRSAEEVERDLGRWLNGEKLFVSEMVPSRVAKPLLLVGMVLLLSFVLLLPGLPLRSGSLPPDSNPAYLKIHELLKQKKKVSLISPDGLPRWHRTVGDPVTLAVDPIDHFGTISAPGVSAIILVDDPQTDHFRFTAEMRHHQSGFGDAAVGIFVGHHFVKTVPGEVHSLCLLQFNDLLNERESVLHLYTKKHILNRNPKWKLPPLPKGNKLRFIAHWMVKDREKVFQYPKLQGKTGFFEPFRGARHVWRKLEIEAHPDHMIATWQDGSDPLAPRMSMGRGDWEGIIEKDLQSRRKRMGEPWFDGMTSEVKPRGGLGLYVRHGRISFRNVEIEPLPGHP